MAIAFEPDPVSTLGFIPDEPAKDDFGFVPDPEPAPAAPPAASLPQPAIAAPQESASNPQEIARQEYEANVEKYKGLSRSGQPMFQEGHPLYRPGITDPAEIKKLQDFRWMQTQAAAQAGDKDSQALVGAVKWAEQANKMGMAATMDQFGPPRVTDTPDPLGETVETIGRNVNRQKGATIGGLVGLGLGAAMAPETGGLSMLVPLITAIAGGGTGGVMQEVATTNFETPDQTIARHDLAATDQRDHAAAIAASNLALVAPFFRPSPTQIVNTAKAVWALRLGKIAAPAERQALMATLGAFGIGAGAHVGTSLAYDQPITLHDVLESGAMMATFNKTTALGRALGLPGHVEAAREASAAGLPRTSAAVAGGDPLATGTPPPRAPAEAPPEVATTPAAPPTAPAVESPAIYDFVQPERVRLRPPESREFVVEVKVPEFDAAWQKDEGFHLPPNERGQSEAGGRRQRFEEWLQQGTGPGEEGLPPRSQRIETPEVGVFPDGRVSFTNGRHRFAVLRDKGVSTVKVSMSPESAELARKFGLTVEAEPSAPPVAGRIETAMGVEREGETRQERDERERLGIDQLAEANPDLVISRQPERQIGEGREHVVEQSDDPTRVMKHTKNGFGYTLHGDTDADGPYAQLRDASPSEALAGMAAKKEAFGDDTRVEGLTKNRQGTGFAVSQAKVEGITPEQGEIDGFMTSKGFQKVPDANLSGDQIKGKTWFNPDSQIVVTDVTPENFKKDAAGTLHPIDVIGAKASPGSPLHDAVTARAGAPDAAPTPPPIPKSTKNKTAAFRDSATGEVFDSGVRSIHAMAIGEPFHEWASGRDGIEKGFFNHDTGKYESNPPGNEWYREPMTEKEATIRTVADLLSQRTPEQREAMRGKFEPDIFDEAMRRANGEEPSPEAAAPAPEPVDAPSPAPEPSAPVSEPQRAPIGFVPDPDPPVRKQFRIPSAPLGVPDVVDFIVEQGGIHLPSKDARSQEHDDAPSLPGVYNRLATEGGAISPDEMAQMLYEAHLIPEPHVPTMWKALEDGVRSRISQRQQQLFEARRNAASNRQQAAFHEATATPGEGKVSVPVENLKIGDTVTTGGDTLEVTDIDPDTYDVTLKGGEKFGTQILADGETIHVESTSAVDGPGESEGGPIGIKNAWTEPRHAEAGLPERAAVLKETFPELMESTLAKVEADSQAGSKLVNRLLEKSGPLTSEEDALLLHETVARKIERDAAERDMETAFTPAEFAAADLRRTNAIEGFAEVLAVSESAGTANARGLNARRMMANEDYTLARLETKERSVRGRALEKDELARVKKEGDEIEKARQKEEGARHEQADQEAEDYTENLLKTLKADAVEAKKAKKPFLDLMEESAKRAQERRAQRKGRTNILVDPAELADLAIIGANHIARGISNIVEFGQRLKAEVGDWIEEHIPVIFAKAQEVHAAMQKLHGKPKEPATPQQVIEKAKANAAAGNDLSHRTVYRLAEAFARQGVGAQGGRAGMTELMGAVHDALLTLHKGLTVREVRDTFTDYGKATYPSKDAIKMQLAEARVLARLQTHLENAQKGLASAKSGPQRAKATEEVRRLQKEVNAMRRKMGVRNVYPERQIATSLEASKTRMRNEIEELDTSLSTRTRMVNGKREVILDAEATALKTERDAKRKLYDEMFPKEPMTEAERIAHAVKSLDKRIAEEDKMLREGILRKPKGAALPESDAIQRRQAELDAMRDLRHDLDAAQKTPDEHLADAVQAAKDSIDKENERLESGKYAADPKAQAKFTPSVELEGLLSERDAMRRARRELARVPRSQAEKAESARQSALKALDKRIAELDRRLQAGDYSETQQQPGLASQFDDVQARRAEVKAMNDLYRSLDEVVNIRARKAIARREADLQSKIDRGDYTRESPKKRVLEEATEQAQAGYQHLKNKFDTRMEQLRIDRLNNTEKAFDLLSGVSRGGKLTRLTTLAKLLAFSVDSLVFKPIRELAAGVYSKTPGMRRLSRLADIEGGGSTEALGGFYKGFIYGLKNDAMKPLQQILSIFSRGRMGDISARSEIKTLWAKEGVHLDPRWWDVPQLIHEAEKNPLKRAAFEYGLKKLERSYQEQGKDITKPGVKSEIRRAAYEYAQRTILMNQTPLSQWLNAGIRRMELPDKDTGRTSISAKAGVAAAKSLLVFNTVATNHLVGLWNHVAGIPHGGLRLARALATGIESLGPKEANSIMRQLKDGSVGAAMLGIGMLMANSFGGMDPKRKRKDGEPGFGEMQIGGHTIPRWVAMASPPLMAAQIGATIVHTLHSKLRKSDPETQGALAATLSAAAGVAHSGPIVNEAVRFDDFMDERTRKKYVFDFLRSNIVPGLVDEIARTTDRKDGQPVQRVSDSLVESFKQSIPWLRQTLPTKDEASAATKQRVKEMKKAEPKKPSWMKARP